MLAARTTFVCQRVQCTWILAWHTGCGNHEQDLDDMPENEPHAF